MDNLLYDTKILMRPKLVVFSSTRRSLSKLVSCYANSSISCIAILNYQGQEDQFQEIQTEFNICRQEWLTNYCFNRPLLNPRNETPLWCAAYYGICDSTLIKCCLSQGYELDEPDAVHGYTPLMIASVRTHEAEPMRLLQTKSDVSSKSFTRDSVLHFACLHGCINVVKYLYQFKDGKRLALAKNALGMVPRAYALEHHHVKILEIMDNE